MVILWGEDRRGSEVLDSTGTQEERQAHRTRTKSPMTNTVPRDSHHNASLHISRRIWKVIVTAASPPLLSSTSPTACLGPSPASSPAPARHASSLPLCLRPQTHLPLAWPPAPSGLVFDFKLVDCSAKRRKMSVGAGGADVTQEK